MSSGYEIIKGAIHGYIKVFDHERTIIDTPIFQRLRRITQNTGVHFTYPCANHTRFSHSLGVMHVAGRFTERLLEQIPKASNKIKKRYYFLMRLWGLTHDIGQGPFSHLFDDIIFGPKYKTDHERFGAKILRESHHLPDELDIGNGIKITLGEVANLFEVKTIDDWPLTERIGQSDVNEKIFYYVCRGAYSADIMDFLLRDSYFTGAGYGNVDWQRLVHASKPVGDKVILDTRGEEAFDSLLLARLFMFSAVYYHRTTRATTKIMGYYLNEAASLLDDFKEFITNLEKYTHLDEHSIMYFPELLDSAYRKFLMEREIPYSRYVEEIRKPDIGISDKDLSKILTSQTRERLPNNLKKSLPEEAFFVDTPIIPLNPMFGGEEEYIFLSDPNVSDGFRARRVWETSWGILSKQVLLLRLFIHDKCLNQRNEIVNAFKMKGERTHF